jgi:hypothetical protein
MKHMGSPAGTELHVFNTKAIILRFKIWPSNPSNDRFKIFGHTKGRIDNLALLINGKFPSTASENILG